jgi:RimJ/RimL family protein N-acetyltransferase
VVLAGLKDTNKRIEFCRIVINQKGKGYGRKAIQKIKGHCFKKLKCHRLWLGVLATNERAKHLYLSEAFREEGRIRDAIQIDNKFKDLIIISMLAGEY